MLVKASLWALAVLTVALAQGLFQINTEVSSSTCDSWPARSGCASPGKPRAMGM